MTLYIGGTQEQSKDKCQNRNRPQDQVKLPILQKKTSGNA